MAENDLELVDVGDIFDESKKPKRFEPVHIDTGIKGIDIKPGAGDSEYLKSIGVSSNIPTQMYQKTSDQIGAMVDINAKVAEGAARGAGSVTLQGITGMGKGVLDAYFALGGALSDATGLEELGKEFRREQREIDAAVETIRDWNAETILGDDSSAAKTLLGVAETVGSFVGLGGLIKGASAATAYKGINPAFLAPRVKEGTVAAVTFGAMGEQGFKSEAERQGKEITPEVEKGAKIAGATSAAAGFVAQKLTGIFGGDKAKRFVEKSFGNMLKSAARDVAGGAAAGAAIGAGHEAADIAAYGPGEDSMKDRAARVATSTLYGAGMVVAMKGVNGAAKFFADGRAEYASWVRGQAAKASDVARKGLPLVKGDGVGGVSEVTKTGEVIFRDGTIYRPATPEVRTPLNEGGYKVVPAKPAEIRLFDGTILNEAGEVVGVAAGPWKQNLSELDAQPSANIAELEKLNAPASVKEWMAAPKDAKPRLDAEGQAFMRIYLELSSANPNVKNAAAAAMERVNKGELKLTDAANLIDEARAGLPEGTTKSAAPETPVIPSNGAPTEVAKPEVRPNGSANLTTVRAAERLVDWVNDGTIKPTEVDVTEIQVRESANPNGPLIVREDNSGVKTVISGTVPEGAATVEAVVVRESDGWGVDEAKTISYVVKLQNPDVTVPDAVVAVSRLSVDNQEISDVIGGEASAAVQTAERIVDNATPSVRYRVTAENAENVAQLVDTVNVKTVGEGWQDKQSALFDTMPAEATPLEVNVAGRITIAGNTIKPEEAWEIAAWTVANLHVPGVIDNVNNPKALRELMANDSVGAIPVEQSDGSFKSVNEIEAKSLGGIEATLPPMPEVDHSLDLTSVPNKPGTFAAARFPYVNVTIGQSDGTGKIWVVEGLTPQMMLEPRARDDMGRFLADLAEKAGAAGAQIDVGDPALVELANELMANHYDAQRDRAMKARQGAVESLLVKSGLANNVISDQAAFDAALDSISGGKTFMKDGRTWGFYDPKSGNIYINGALFGTKTGLGVTIHEFAHPAVIATKKINRPLYDRGMELAAKVPFYNQLKSDPAYANMSEETLREEVLVHILQGRLEDIKSQVPAKIYKEIEDFVNQFWRRFGEVNGIRDLTPDMVATMTIEDVTDAIGAEMMSGRPFGEKRSSARSASENGDEYSYNALTQRPDMTLTQINPANFKNYSSDAQRVRDAKDSVLAAGGRRIDGAVVIKMDGSDVVVSSSGIKHRGKKPHRENDMLYPVLGEVLKNAIPVNELAPRSGEKKDSNVNNTFVFLGAFAYKNEICPVRIQVVQKNRTKRLDSIDVLKSLNTKIGKIDAPDKSDLTREAPSALAEISIANLINVAQPLHPEIFSRDVSDALNVTYRGKEINARFSVGGIFTGSAADYANRSRQGGVDDGPSLVKIGKSNGVAFGWGLYGSTAKSDAENFGDNIYEQTFFTNRPEGDESHLIDWEKPLTEENKNRILDGLVYEARKNKAVKKAVERTLADEARDFGLDESDDYEPESIEGMADDVLREAIERTIDVQTDKGRSVYTHLAALLTGKSIGEVNSFTGRLDAFKTASEFLRDECDIDGIKYPAESDGAKHGETHYVSFRDDNIRVDHKWTDGEQRFARGGSSPMGREVFVAGRARVADDAERGERLPGVIAASAELSGQIHTPISQARRRTVSLPLSEIEWLRKQVTGNVIPTKLKRWLPDKRWREGKIVLAADVFGLVDKTDMAEIKTQLKANGYFRNEDPLWYSNATANDIALEEKRSEDALADKLIELGDNRVSGREAGGVSAARGVFADQVAQVILDLPANAPGTTGAMRKLGDAFLRNVCGFDAEADKFLDWAYGPASAPRTPRERAGQMLGAFMVMPHELQEQTPNYMTAIADMITNDPRLEHAWRQLSLRGLSNQAHSRVAKEIEESFSRAHDEAVAKIVAEGNEPIKVGKWKSKKPSDWIDGVKDNIIVGFSDAMGTVVVRVDARAKAYVKAKKKVIKQTKDPQTKKQIEKEINRFMGAIGQMKNQIELSRTAYERGAWNEDLTYLYRMRDLEDVANLRWGLTESDKVMYLNLKRVIETEGRSGSRGITPRQAQMQLDEMKARLGGAKWQSLENYGNRFHAIIDQDFLSDPRLERMFGKGWVDYCKSQVNYVTAKRTWSQEELDAIELAREDARRRGVAGGDDVVEQMYAYGQRAGAMTDQLVGSMADTADVRGATWEKHMAIKQAVRRNQLVLDLRDALLTAGVEGVRDVCRGESAFPANKRYGYINYLLNGQKRTLIVPREIADGFKVNPQSANLLGTLATMARSGFIDYNVGFRLIANPLYDQSAYVWKMPGTREPIPQTVLRWTVLGGDLVYGIVSQWMARKIPGFAKMFGKDTIFRYFPEAKAVVEYLRAPEKWMEKFMKAEQSRDWKKMRKLRDARDNALGALKANMFLPASSEFLAGKSEGFANDVLNMKGIRTIAQKQEQELAKSWMRKTLETINIFKRNKAGMEADDMITKFAAYLHDRVKFGNVRTPRESGVLVKQNIATPDVVRRGKHTRSIQNWVFQFFNAAEKGIEGFYRSAKNNPKDFWIRFANVFGARLVSSLVSAGVIWKVMLDDCEGDEEKAKEKYGMLYDYAKWRYRAGQNLSDYQKKNYAHLPFWLSADGYTTLSLAGVISMEDRLVTPWADYVAQDFAHKAGIGVEPSFVDALANTTIKSVVPDMALAAPQWKILNTTIVSMWSNPHDMFTGRDYFSKDVWESRFDGGAGSTRFAAEVGMRLWNDLGGRAVWEFDREKAGDERNAAPEGVIDVLSKIPVVSPALRRLIKVQVGSPEKRGAMIEEAYQKRLRTIRLCAKELLKAETNGEWLFRTDPKKYDEMKADMMKTYGLDEYAWAEVEAKYINTSNERAYWKDEDLKEYNRLRHKANKLGMDPADVDFILGDE